MNYWPPKFPSRSILRGRLWSGTERRQLMFCHLVFWAVLTALSLKGKMYLIRLNFVNTAVSKTANPGGSGSSECSLDYHAGSWCMEWSEGRVRNLQPNRPPVCCRTWEHVFTCVHTGPCSCWVILQIDCPCLCLTESPVNENAPALCPCAFSRGIWRMSSNTRATLFERKSL